jgi:hypothetical protein
MSPSFVEWQLLLSTVAGTLVVECWSCGMLLLIVDVSSAGVERGGVLIRTCLVASSLLYYKIA